MPVDTARYWPEQRDMVRVIPAHRRDLADSTRVCATRLAEPTGPSRRRRENGALLAEVAAVRAEEPGLSGNALLARLSERGVKLPGRLRRYRPN